MTNYAPGDFAVFFPEVDDNADTTLGNEKELLN